MKLRSIGLACVLGGSCVIASAMGAQALDFNFSFDGNRGTNPGRVTGSIRGLDNNRRAANATADVISSPLGSLEGYSFRSRSFRIRNGNISQINAVIFFNFVTGSNLIDNDERGNDERGINGLSLNSQNVFNRGEATGVTYTAATTVPFDFNPVEGVALGVPLFIGLRLLIKKKLARKSAAVKFVKTVS